MYQWPVFRLLFLYYFLFALYAFSVGSLTLERYPANMTTEQQKRVTAEWSTIAKEPVTIELISGAMYAFGSELACLRLGWKFRDAKPTAPTVKYSVNLETWFFSLDCPMLAEVSA